MSKRNHIEGVIRLSTPLHCAMPGEKASLNEPTQTMKIKLISGRDRQDTMPFFPGNGLRGRFRRKAASFVMPALVNGKKLPPELYAGLTCGAADNQPENELSVEEALRYSKNVYMGLFGGGKRMLRSRYSVQDLVPITQSTIAASLVPEKFEHPDEEREEKLVEDAFRLIDYLHFIHKDDVMHVVRPDEMAAIIENAGATVSAYQAFNLAQSATRKAEKKENVSKEDRTKKTNLDNMMKIEVIAPGTPMYFRLDFDDGVTDAQVGLMLQSLQAVVDDNALGGWTRAGLGKYSIVRMNLMRNGVEFRVFKEEADGYSLHESVMPFALSAQEQVAALSRDEMLSYFTSSKPQGE